MEQSSAKEPLPFQRVKRRRLERLKRLREHGYKDYAEYMGSPAWAKTKARYRQAEHLPQVCMCGAHELLQLHHKTYDRVCEEELEDLTPLCRRCHVLVHQLERQGIVMLDFEGLYDEARADDYRPAEDERKRAAHEEYRRLEDPMPTAIAFVLACNRLRGMGVAPRRELKMMQRMTKAIEHRCDVKAQRC